ncbi:MAG: hypothetical protein DMG07_08750 [Acidobacteria bacterium]|nr:MAG: hypothetical protein DMG07_08750 [Acidobacteriota bacterium]
MTPKLTLNMGLRYELRLGWRDKRGFLSNVDVSCANGKGPTGTLIPDCYQPPVKETPAFPATGRFEPGVAILREARTSWQPRLGLSYRLTSRTVVRSGFGLYGNEAPGGIVYGALLGNPRANSAARVFISDPKTPTISLSNPFLVSALVPGAALPSVGGFEYPLPNWYVPNWGLSIEHMLTENTMLEVGYEGSHSVHELQIIDYNDAVPGLGSRQSRRPFPQLQTYRLLAGNGDKNYNGLEVKLEKRPGPKGLSTLLAYTWSKSLDTMGGRFIGGVDPTAISRNVTNKENRGLGEANIPMRLAMMVGYDSPFGRGKPYLNDGVLGRIIGGWSTYGLLTLQKGLWFTATDIDRLDVGSSSSQRPQLVGNPNLPSDQRTPERWFNTAAFTTPPGKYGNAGRGIIEAPGFGNLDFALVRDFRVSETMKVQFRFEAFNISNHTNFSAPTTSFASPKSHEL